MRTQTRNALPSGLQTRAGNPSVVRDADRTRNTSSDPVRQTKHSTVKQIRKGKRSINYP